MKTIKLSKQIFLVSVFFLGMSCNIFGITGKGNVISQKRVVADFNSIELLSSADVEVIKGKNFEVIVSDYENIIEHIIVKVVDNQLVIDADHSVKINKSNAKVTVTMPDKLYTVSLKGSGDMDVKSNFINLGSISVSGSGNIRSENCCGIDDLNVFVYGSGNIDIKGNVLRLKAIISGSGDLNLFDLLTESAECFMLGSGDIKVTALKELSATNSGAGNIIYKGEPLVDMNVNGVGSVKRF
jgi:hypothetical protein